eukprot:8209972-Karenia_brevis.AAC.1
MMRMMMHVAICAKDHRQFAGCCPGSEECGQVVIPGVRMSHDDSQFHSIHEYMQKTVARLNDLMDD